MGLGPAGSPEAVRNIILVATDEPALLAEEIRRRTQALVAAGVVTVDGFLDAAGDLHGTPIASDDVPLFSAAFGPVDLLIAPG